MGRFIVRIPFEREWKQALQLCGSKWKALFEFRFKYFSSSIRFSTFLTSRQQSWDSKDGFVYQLVLQMSTSMNTEGRCMYIGTVLGDDCQENYSG